MTGRGIDQILPHPVPPHLFEPYVRSAIDYVELAERGSGPIPRRVASDYLWGDALGELERMRPDARIVNLETSVTVSEDAVVGKGIHYRMHPANVSCLAAAKLDCCVLANNHVLDWGRAGLAETIAALRSVGIRTAGAGRDAEEAASPAVIERVDKGRVLVFALAAEDSGVPAAWAATATTPGVNFLRDLSATAIAGIAHQVGAHKRSGDVVVLSIHWGGNWDYRIAGAARSFAHGVIDGAGVDVVHGHSSHHVKGIEVYHGRPILYGCGDFLNDYEGIGGYEPYRADLALMYFPVLAAEGHLLRFTMVPTRTHRFRIGRAAARDVQWLKDMLCREGRDLGTSVAVCPDGTLALHWT